MVASAEPRRGIFAIRDVRDLTTETEEAGHQLKRSVSAVQLTSMGVGAIIGTGIFVVIGTILRILTLPLILLTLGLMSFAITVGMLALTAWLSSKLDIDGFWSAVGAALIVAIVSAVIEGVTHRVATT